MRGKRPIIESTESTMISDNIQRSPSCSLKSAVAELLKGRELASQLRALLQGDAPHASLEPTSTTTALTRALMGAFTTAIAALDPESKPEELRARGNSGVRRKMRSPPTGCYRRRSNPCSRARVEEAKTLEDGHSWRKYGQKEIYKAKFSRSYFRCVHKSDQGCTATRQVQRSEEDPSLFVITYFGDHTCRDPAEVLSSCLQGGSRLIDFASHAKSQLANGERVEAMAGGRAELEGNPGYGRAYSQCCYADHQTPAGSSSSELCFELPEIGTMEGSAKLVIGDHGDVTSELQAAVDSGWDFMEQPFEFSDLLGLELMDF